MAAFTRVCTELSNQVGTKYQIVGDHVLKGDTERQYVLTE